MGSAFHQLCPRYSGTLTPTAPTAIRLWDTFTFTLLWPYNLTCDPSDLGHGNHNFVYDISSHYVSPFQEFNPICI